MKLLACFLMLFTLSCQNAPTPNEVADNIHKDLLTLDTHIDFDTKDFKKHRHYGQNLNTQVNIVKMEQGELDAGFFIVYTGQNKLHSKGYKKAHKQAMAKFRAIHKMTTKLIPEKIGLAKNPQEVRNIWSSGRKVAMIGVENAYPLGTDLTKLKKFYDLGARYISITHNGHNQFGDSNVPKAWDKITKYNGLSPLGEKLVHESNRLGIMLDISHASQKTAQDVIRLSQAPVIASHSSVAGVYKHPRNLTDQTLKALKKNNGVVQIVAFRSYVKKPSNDLKKEYHRLSAKYKLPKGNVWNTNNKIWNALSKRPQKVRSAYYNELVEIDKKHDKTSVQDFVDHIDYAVKKIGINHVGISSDFGGGGGIHGWSNASETWNITRELHKRGYKRDEIAKLWGENLLRVWSDVEKYAKNKL